MQIVALLFENTGDNHMINIAICDDEIVYQNIIREKVDETFIKEQEEYATFLYASGKEMLEAVGDISFDIILLDIDMPEESGLIVADAIVDKLPRTNVVFITNRDDLVFEALKCAPFGFVRKTHIDEMYNIICRMINKIKKDNYLLVFSDKSSNVSLPVYDIYYIESIKHYLYIHTEKQEFKVRMKISFCEEKIKGCGFIKIHKGIIVNVRRVKSLTSKEAILFNNVLLPISRSNADKVKIQFSERVERYVDGIIV